VGHQIPLEMAHLLLGQTPGPGGGSPLFTGVIWLVVMLGVLWFLMIRPEQKKRSTHEQLISALKKGDEIILNSGIFAKVLSVDEGTISAEIGDKTRIKVLKSSVHALASQFQPASANKAVADGQGKTEKDANDNKDAKADSAKGAKSKSGKKKS
jgi:preprotein translocase subunit YajC